MVKNSCADDETLLLETAVGDFPARYLFIRVRTHRRLQTFYGVRRNNKIAYAHDTARFTSIQVHQDSTWFYRQ
jgi:hypothetical protein